MDTLLYFTLVPALVVMFGTMAIIFTLTLGGVALQSLAQVMDKAGKVSYKAGDYILTELHRIGDRKSKKL